MEEQKREFRGIWIPKEIYLNKSLTWNEKILLIEIDSLDNEQGCFSSNKNFAEFLGVTERAVTGMIAKLKKLGYISQSSFDGRRRVLHSNIRVCLSAQNGCSSQSGSKLLCTPEADFQQNNISNNIENKDTPIAPKRGIYSERFERFWKAYPCKVGKVAAWKVFQRLHVDDSLLETMLKAIEIQKQSDRWKRGFIPNPRTWLNQGRWEDETQNMNASDKKEKDDYLC